MLGEFQIRWRLFTAAQSYLRTWMLSANPGYHPVHDFPVLDHLPDFLAPWRKYGKGLHTFEMNLYTSLSSKVRQEMARGEQPDVIMRYCLERKEEFGMDECVSLQSARLS